MSIRRVVLVGGILVAVVAFVLEINPALFDPLPGGVEPLPEPTRDDFKTAQAGDATKYWPSSAPVEQGVEYRFNTGHCGLGWMTDFDGSFWTPEPYDSDENDVLFSNADSGTMELVSEDRAIFRSSSGVSAFLTRNVGPLVTEEGCA